MEIEVLGFGFWVLSLKVRCQQSLQPWPSLDVTEAKPGAFAYDRVLNPQNPKPKTQNSNPHLPFDQPISTRCFRLNLSL
jgi:hypothetical protein